MGIADDIIGTHFRYPDYFEVGREKVKEFAQAVHRLFSDEIGMVNVVEGVFGTNRQYIPAATRRLRRANKTGVFLVAFGRQHQNPFAFARLHIADALKTDTPAQGTGTPKDLTDEQIVKTLPVVADSPCPLPDALLPALMRRARLLAMSSLNEGFGLVALEALACGTPVLVSRRAPFTEHLAGSPGVSWCEPEDLANLTQGLARAWHAPRLGVAPPVCQRLAWRRSALAHQTIHAQVLAGHTSPRDPEASFSTLSTPLA